MSTPPPRILLLKALMPGERWITVHPHGPDEKGQPVLIKENPDGSAHVIGGAGGKLNNLKLVEVRPKSSYAKEAKQRAAGRREEQKRLREHDKRLGLTANKAARRAVVKDRLTKEAADLVTEAADALGWSPEEMRFPAEKYRNASPAARTRAEQKHMRELVKKANEAADAAAVALASDAEMRAAAGLGEVPLTAAAPDTLSVQDLDPVAPSSGQGLGFAPAYGKRAAEAGLTEDEKRAEAAAAKPVPADATVRATAARKEKGAAIARELAAIRDPGPTVDPRAAVEAAAAAKLLRARKRFKVALAAGRAERKRIDKDKEAVDPKAYVIETGELVDADLVKDLENDLRTIRTRGFLSEAGKVAGGLESLGQHVGVGAYNSLNALALAAGGAGLIDRSVVDVLGAGEAAKVLARRLQSDLTPEEMEQIREAMGRFHVEHYMALSDSALREARALHEQAAEIEIGEAATGAELAVAQELNAKRRDAIASANRILGTALGEMEGNAALVTALGAKQTKAQVSLGRTSPEAAITQARAIGLQRGEYQVEKAGASTMLTIGPAGMDRLARPVAREDLERLRASLDIMQGGQDEAGWLPQGVAQRPDLGRQVKPGTAERLARPFARAPEDMRQAVRDYIGGRSADGDAPADIVADLLSEETMQRAGDRSAFMAAVNAVAPLYDKDGQMLRAEAHEAAFDGLADDYAAKMGGDRTPLQRQQFPVDDAATEALHRALAQTPEGVAAFKPVGELLPEDQAALRGVFAKEYGRVDPAAEAMRAQLEKLDGAEPEREVEDMFGVGVNPAWREWQTERNDLAEKLNKASMTWGKYLDVMGSPANAYAALQDVLRGRLVHDFAESLNRLRPDAPLRQGKRVIAHDLNHLDALDPAAREKRLAVHRDLVDSLRNRVAGRYAAGSVADKLDAARAAEQAASQAQMGFFGATETPAEDPAAVPEPAAPEMGERWTIGHEAERQLAGMMPSVGANFRPGQPVKLMVPAMSGKYIGRQRAVKLIKHNKRAGLGLGVGSGKTSIALSAFTDLKAEGKVSKGLFVVPSVVQGQFGGEALALLEPGKYRWHCAPGAAREDRIAAYKDPNVDFAVVTHASFRDDLLHLAAARDGSTPTAVAERLDKMTAAERQAYIGGVLEAEGIKPDYLAVDEGHTLLNRAGKQNSAMANAIDAVAHASPYYVSMTADPVKNDVSEAYDALRKLDPARYSDRDAFMRRYGVDTPAAADGLRRELARYYYTGQIDPGVAAHRQQIEVKLGQDQRAELQGLSDAAGDARLARMRGRVDVDALKRLSPSSFAGVAPELHESVARELNRSIGILHDTAQHRAVNGGAKTEALANIADARRDRSGVVFVHSLDRVREIAARLEQDGHKVLTMTGADSSADKDKIKRAFKDGSGPSILVASDAGAVGANLQTGKWLVQYDTPMTAMLHAQRNGRIHRIGQNQDVELLDLVADHPAEAKARKRLATKYELRGIVTSPLDGLDDTGIAGMLNRIRAGQAEAEAPLHLPAGPGDADPEPAEQAGQAGLL